MLSLLVFQNGAEDRKGMTADAGRSFLIIARRGETLNRKNKNQRKQKKIRENIAKIGKYRMKTEKTEKSGSISGFSRLRIAR